MRWSVVLPALVLVFFLTGADGLQREATVVVSGSSTVMPLAELAAEEFNLMQSSYRVNVKSGGSGVGIVDLAEGRADIAMTSR
ncbi:MAG: substrate-binding domain-containing protein, partial [Methanothrix sp.]|nr:substrate-binding domain-containing protein [Methanothrix sp.]